MRPTYTDDRRSRAARRGGPGFGADFGPEGGPPWGRGRGRGRGRARRGDVRAAMLALLAERPMHGYEMIQVLEERTGGVWRPSPGSVYPALQLLEDEGLVTADAESGKRLFTLTDAGREAAATAAEGGTTPWDEVTAGVSPDDRSLRRLTGQVMLAVRQVAEAGDPEAKARAIEVLTDTRKRLYGILAEAG